MYSSTSVVHSSKICLKSKLISRSQQQDFTSPSTSVILATQDSGRAACKHNKDIFKLVVCAPSGNAWHRSVSHQYMWLDQPNNPWRNQHSSISCLMLLRVSHAPIPNTTYNYNTYFNALSSLNMVHVLHRLGLWCSCLSLSQQAT
jgi:hypothetical protein